MNITVEQALEATPEVHNLGIAPRSSFGVVVRIVKVWLASPPRGSRPPHGGQPDR